MEGPPLASSLNNSAGGKMADIQQCRDGGQRWMQRQREKNESGLTVDGKIIRKKWKDVK